MGTVAHVAISELIRCFLNNRLAVPVEVIHFSWKIQVYKCSNESRVAGTRHIRSTVDIDGIYEEYLPKIPVAGTAATE